MTDANKEVVINYNTPHTPRKQGAEIASQENYTLALDLWQATCSAAGLPFIVDNCTANGARKVAARYLDTGMVTPEDIKQAMRKLADLIQNNERSRHYTLNALGNNISRYLPPKKEAVSSWTKFVWWEYKCHSCGASSAKMNPATPQPQSVPCNTSACGGTMIPERT